LTNHIKDSSADAVAAMRHFGKAIVSTKTAMLTERQNLAFAKCVAVAKHQANVYGQLCVQFVTQVNKAIALMDEEHQPGFTKRDTTKQ
jgi:hypothetical protein